MSVDRINVVVVGGGIIGCATAYYLARAGAQVTLLERGALCGEASAAAAGILNVSNREGLFLTLARESLRMLREVREELETDFQLSQRGSLTLVFSEEELGRLRQFVERQRLSGISVELLDRKATLKAEPKASPEVLGAVYSPIDCSVNPYLATLAYARAARRLGANLRNGAEVSGLKVEGGRVKAAVTRDSEIGGDVVVVAAGSWSLFLTRTVGLELPIEPSRGQMLVTDPLPHQCRAVVKDADHMYICPTSRGNYVIGSMVESVGFNKQVTVERLSDYLTYAVAFLPSLRSARVLHTWAGLRPLTPDSFPLLGEVPGYEGLVLATGHSRTGILLSALTCSMVADLITKGTTDFLMESLTLKRFTNCIVP